MLPRTWKDCVIDGAVLVLFLCAVALTLLGSYAAVRLLGGWNQPGTRLTAEDGNARDAALTSFSRPTWPG